MKKIIRNIATVPMTITYKAFQGINQIAGKVTQLKSDLHRSIISPFLPKYEVVFVMYSVIPGRSVEKQETIYNFDKGKSNEAQLFFNRTVQSTLDFKVMPSEVYMKKRNKIIKSECFGPVKELQALSEQ